MQVCTSLQTDNHASTPPQFFYRLDALPAPTNSIKALKADIKTEQNKTKHQAYKKLLHLLQSLNVLLFFSGIESWLSEASASYLCHSKCCTIFRPALFY